MPSASLAAMVGRPDLSSTYNVMTVTPQGYSQGGRMAPAASLGPSGSFSTSVSGDVALGQTSLGMLAGMILGLALFYVWTRGRQV